MFHAPITLCDVRGQVSGIGGTPNYNFCISPLPTPVSRSNWRWEAPLSLSRMSTERFVSRFRLVAAAGVTLVIVPHAHTVEDIDELVVVLLVFKDSLMIDASHHHVEYPSV